jgi:aspartate carbamoyltransferase regulatory subunit
VPKEDMHPPAARKGLYSGVTKFQAEVGRTNGGGRLRKYHKIEEGTTIDHILPGKALDIIKTLGITPESGDPIVILLNVKSTKMGKKDVIKLENVKLDPEGVIAKINKIAPGATVDIIKHYEVVRKVKYQGH